jgi:general secretion pathway protein N
MARAPRRDPTARGEPGAARKFGKLLTVGLAALACFAVATLPASLVSGPLHRSGISAAAYSGTIWSGVASDVAWRGATLGELRWHAHPMALLRAHAAADVTFARSDGSASASVAAGLGGTIDLSNVRLDLPIEFLAQVMPGMARNWHGRASGAFSEFRLVSGWPVAARGTLHLSELVMPQLGQVAIGSFEIVAPDPGTSSTDVTARVSDKEGPLSLDAVLTLSPGRSFDLQGTVATRAGAPPDLVRSLEFLGPADPDGRRQFGVSGTF